jgi:hypothetical protein
MIPKTTTARKAMSQTIITQPMPPVAWASTGVGGVFGVSGEWGSAGMCGFLPGERASASILRKTQANA